jgi:hypothetical protein
MMALPGPMLAQDDGSRQCQCGDQLESGNASAAPIDDAIASMLK